MFPTAQLVSASYFPVSVFFFTQSFKPEIKFSPKNQLCSSSKRFNTKANILAHIL